MARRRLSPEQQKSCTRKFLFPAPPPRSRSRISNPIVDRLMKQAVKDPSKLEPRDLEEIRLQITARVETNYTDLPPGMSRLWGIDSAQVEGPLAR
jgi:hypothetical protein